ncbi:MAG: thymidylate synthase [Candidatus Woesearchaeota archaeon]|jgi:thymidylate synthase
MNAKDVTETWKKIITHVAKSKRTYVDCSQRVCKEQLHTMVVIDNIVKRAEEPIFRMTQLTPYLYPSPEQILRGFMTSQDDGLFCFSHGWRLFSWMDQINQIDEFIIPLLTQDQHSRRAVATLYSPSIDSKIYKTEVPCFVSIDIKRESNKLLFFAHIRSCDVVVGLPINLYQLSSIASYIAKKLGCKVGSTTIFFASAHYFKEQEELANRIIS